MEKHYTMRKRIWASIAGVLLIISLAVFLSGSPVYGLAGDGGSGKTVLAFTSDIHNSGDNTAANRLEIWLDKIERKYGGIDVMSFCGDMGFMRANESEYWDYTNAVMRVFDDESIPKIIYTTGNHEFYNGKFGETENALKSNFEIGEVGASDSKYIIYCLGTDNWDRSHDNYTESQIALLKDFLNSTGNDRPIIILTHFPLHTFGSFGRPRQTENADLVIDTLNEAAGRGKKIVLLWGHNHTVSDTYYDEIYAPGDSIEYVSGSYKELDFYYGAAGCMSDSENGTGSAFVKGKGLVITIDNDKKLAFAYYDANGNNVTEGGTYSEIPVQATDMVIDESIEEGEGGQPVTVGQTILEGKKLQLHLTIEPEDASYRGLSWSSSNEAVATVRKDGLVKGLSEGTVTITATIPATPQTAKLSASIKITVRKKDKVPVFVLTDKLEPGRNYIIANKSTGTAYALTNDDGTVAMTEVKIDGDKITASDESIIFTADGSDENAEEVANIRNDDSYLQMRMGRMSFADSSMGGRPWTYSADRKLTCQGSRSNYYLYYDGDKFMATMDETAAGEVFLFAETEISPDPEPDPDSGTKPDPDPEPDADSETNPEPDSDAKPDSETKPDPVPSPAPAPARKVSGTLLPKMTSRGDHTLVLTWNSIKGADGYDIFFGKCGMIRAKKVKTVKAGKTLRLKKTGLRKQTAYHACVKAYIIKNGTKKYVKRRTVHAYTSGGSKKYTNARSVTITKSDVSLKTGTTYRIKANVTRIRKGKKLMPVWHAPKLRYVSSRPGIARVSKLGKITGKSPGTCKVYVIAVNGAKRTVSVTVKQK